MKKKIPFRYRGARTMVILHEQYMRQFFEIWNKAKKSGTELPLCDDHDYASYNTLLRHVLRASRGYMVWMCKMLNLPDPEIAPAPEAENIESEVKAYLEHLIERWLHPLSDIPEERFYKPSFKSNWKVDYCIDAMLEHAVMHPIRHSFQLMELLDKRGK